MFLYVSLNTRSSRSLSRWLTLFSISYLYLPSSKEHSDDLYPKSRDTSCIWTGLGGARKSAAHNHFRLNHFFSKIHPLFEKADREKVTTKNFMTLQWILIAWTTNWPLGTRARILIDGQKITLTRPDSQPHTQSLWSDYSIIQLWIIKLFPLREVSI